MTTDSYFLPVFRSSGADMATEEAMPPCDCTVTYDYVVGTDCNAVTNLTSSSIYPSVPNGSVVLIRGQLNVDADYTFSQNCVIYMDRGAQVVVKAGNRLTLKDNTVQGCGYLWKSIYVENTAKLRLKGHVGTKIKDGEYAVHLEDGSQLQMQEKTVFLNNYISVYYFSTGGPVCDILPFRGVFFQGTATLKPHYDGTSSYPWAYAGIYVSGHSMLKIGDVSANVSGDKNEFTGLRNGVLAYNSEVEVYASKFSELHDLDYATAGFGIRVQSGSLIVPGTRVKDHCEFVNCERGIYMGDGDLLVKYTDMTGIADYGIMVEKGAYNDIEIQSNDIESTYRGIISQSNDPVNQLTISQNTVSILQPSPSSDGKEMLIRLVGSNQLPVVSATVAWNILTGADVPWGVYMNGIDGYNLSFNQISMSHSTILGYRGIHLLNSDYNSLCQNTVTGDYLINNQGNLDIPAGIALYEAKYSLLECNSTTKVYNGLFVDMSCTNSKIRTSTFQDSRYGLHYSVTGITGLQPDGMAMHLHGNRWYGMWTAANGAKHENSNPAFYSSSWYFVPPNPLEANPPNVIPPGWFLSDNARPELSCADSYCNNQGLSGGTGPGVLEQAVVQGQVNPGIYAEQINWTLAGDVYLELMNHGDWLQNNPLFQSFYDSLGFTSLGNLITLQEQLKGLFALSASDQTVADFYRQEQDSLWTVLQQLDGQLADAMNETDSLLINAERAEVMLAMTQATASEAAFWNAVLQARVTVSELLIVQNAALEPANVMENNYKIVQEVFLSTVAQGVYDLDGAQTAVLAAVASQCPYAGGGAVFMARALLSLVGMDMNYEEVSCSGNTELLQPETSFIAEPEKTAKVYPNPAKDELVLDMGVLLEEKVVLYLYDVRGREVQRWLLPVRQRFFRLNLTSDLTEGVYLLEWQWPDGGKENRRVFLLK